MLTGGNVAIRVAVFMAWIYMMLAPGSTAGADPYIGTSTIRTRGSAFFSKRSRRIGRQGRRMYRAPEEQLESDYEKW